MSKKLTRAQRKDLRAKGQLKPVARLAGAQKAAEKQAEEEAASARVHEAREAIAHREDAEEDAPERKKGKRDLTVLVLVAIIAGAGVLLYLLIQRPGKSEPAKPVPTAAPSR